MNTRIIAFVLLFGTTRLVAAQPDAHNMPAQGGNTEQQVSACVRSQQVSLSLADAADRRIELARQTNQPSSMRAAIDDVQAALSAIRTQLASCTQLQSNAATADPNAGHTMNMSAPGRVKEPAPAPGKLVARPDRQRRRRHPTHMRGTSCRLRRRKHLRRRCPAPRLDTPCRVCRALPRRRAAPHRRVPRRLHRRLAPAPRRRRQTRIRMRVTR